MIDYRDLDRAPDRDAPAVKDTLNRSYAHREKKHKVEHSEDQDDPARARFVDLVWERLKTR